MSVLELVDVRMRAAAALAPADDGDPEVFADLVDAVEPPAILLAWADPWLVPSTFGPALLDASLDVLCVAARLEPGAGVAVLEELVTYTIARLRADVHSWPAVTSEAPQRLPIGGVTYLAARLNYRVPVTTESGG